MDIRGIIDIVRADRAIFTILGISLASMYISGNPVFLSIQAMILPVLVQYLVFLINDIKDYGTDLKNRRIDRPLVSGKMSIQDAYILGGVLIVLILILIYVSDLYSSLFSLVFLTISILYNIYLKRIPIIGNMVVALTMVAPILYPYLYHYVQNYRDTFLEIYMIAIFVFGMSRELIKSMEDVHGDKDEGIITLPVLLGQERTKIFVLFTLSLYLALLVYLILSSQNLLSKILLSIIVPLIIHSKLTLAISKDREEFRRIHETMRYIMLLGLLALIKI
ncbi:MAG: UbiA family prenyltransferase [Candidatus Micrarchaeota archaeon]|nr:UbiA family prenyltransferase [Candidatus Micrarchaeota archaeon]MCX8154228.1 UbiA family prenyltransferase [Candidatus Micrarchaeota archaeon]